MDIRNLTNALTNSEAVPTEEFSKANLSIIHYLLTEKCNPYQVVKDVYAAGYNAIFGCHITGGTNKLLSVKDAAEMMNRHAKRWKYTNDGTTDKDSLVVYTFDPRYSAVTPKTLKCILDRIYFLASSMKVEVIMLTGIPSNVTLATIDHFMESHCVRNDEAVPLGISYYTENNSIIVSCNKDYISKIKIGGINLNGNKI